MRSDVENVRKLVQLLGDRGFVDALTNAERLVEDANETIERVEEIEEEAGEAVREANEALAEVDERLRTFDETIRLLEAKIEAGFSLAFFFFGVRQWLDGDVFFAAGLIGMGLLGASALVVTVRNLPQVQRLRQVGEYTTREVERRTDGGRPGSGDRGRPGSGDRGRPGSGDRGRTGSVARGRAGLGDRERAGSTADGDEGDREEAGD